MELRPLAESIPASTPKPQPAWRKVVLATAAAALAAAAGWALQVFLPRFEVVNRSTLKQFAVSRLGGSVYLWQAGYWGRVNQVKIVYTDEEQKGYALNNSATNKPVYSMYMEKAGKMVTAYIQYAPESFAEISAKPGWFDRDVYAAICLAVEGKETGWRQCQEKAAAYDQTAREKKWPGVLVGNVKSWFSWVAPQAYAQSCYGTIVCGRQEFGCRCAGGTDVGKTCTNDYNCTGSYCGCNDFCNLSLGQNLDCNALNPTNQSTCINTNPKACASGCNPDDDNRCQWSLAPTPVPTGAPTPPGCTCNCGGSVPDTCDAYQNTQSRLRGRYYSSHTLTPANLKAIRYEYPFNWTDYDFLVDGRPICSSWSAAVWDGYLYFPATGTYTFKYTWANAGGNNRDRGGAIY